MLPSSRFTWWPGHCAARIRHTGLSRGLTRDPQTQVARPAVRDDLPFATGLAVEDNQVLATLFAPLSHCNWNQHLAAAGFVSEIAKKFDPQRLQFHLAQSSIEHAKEEFTNSCRPAHRRDIGAQHQRVGYVEFHQIIQLFGVAGLDPILGQFANSSFRPAQADSTRGSPPSGGGFASNGIGSNARLSARGREAPSEAGK